MRQARRILLNILSSFIPSKKLRHKLRRENNLILVKKIQKLLPKTYSVAEALKLLSQGYSIARFGDGEFSYILQDNKKYKITKELEKNITINAGNPANQELKDRLKYILTNNDLDKLLIGIPYPETIGVPDPKNLYSFGYINALAKQISLGILNNHNKNIKYANSLISGTIRCVQTNNAVNEYKKIWNNKKVVFIGNVGEKDTENLLFDNIKEKYFILIPKENAFLEYERIITEAKKYTKDHMFIIAAGFTATILAYDLTKYGYQALDIGHLVDCFRDFYHC